MDNGIVCFMHAFRQVYSMYMENMHNWIIQEQAHTNDEEKSRTNKLALRTHIVHFNNKKQVNETIKSECDGDFCSSY